MDGRTEPVKGQAKDGDVSLGAGAGAAAWVCLRWRVG